METRPAQLVLFNELLQSRLPPGPVRVVARLASYNLRDLTGEIFGEDKQQHALRIKLPENLTEALSLNRPYQWLGELTNTSDGALFIVRLMRDVEGIDVALWEQTLQLRRQFLALDS